MPCGCFGKKKKAAEEEEKYRQRDSKSREREPPSPTPVSVPAPTVVPAAPLAAAPTPEGDARLRPEDDPDKTSRRRDVVASFYNDQCELIGFKATGSRPPSAYVGGAHHDGSASVSSSGSPGSLRPGASCRADLAEKRREFFKQLTIESEDGSRPGTRPNSRATNSLTRSRDSNHEEKMSVIQIAKSSLRPVKQSPQSQDTKLPYRPHYASEEEERGMQYRVARELMLKDIRQQAFTLRPSTEKVQFKNMLPAKEPEEADFISNGEADATPFIMETKQTESSERAPPKKLTEPVSSERIQSHTQTKLDLSAVKAAAKQREQIDPEISDLLENLSGQEISELLVDLSEPEMELLPEDSPKPQGPQSQQANSSNQVLGNLAMDVRVSGSEPGIVMQKSTGELPDNVQICTGNGDIQKLSSQPIPPFSIETSATEVSVTEFKQEPVVLPATEPSPVEHQVTQIPSVVEVKQETVQISGTKSIVEVLDDLQMPATGNSSVIKVTQETVMLPASEPTLEVKVKHEGIALPAEQPLYADDKREAVHMPATDPISVLEVKQESVQLRASASPENPPMPPAELPQETTRNVLEATHEFQQESAADAMHRHENMTEIAYPSPENQKPEGIGDLNNTMLPPSVDPSFLRTEEEPEEILLQQSFHQPPPRPAEEPAPLLPEPVVDPLSNVPASQPTITRHSPDEHESLPPAPPTPPSGPEPTPPTQLSSFEGNEQTHEVQVVAPVTLPTMEEPLLILDEPLPPAPPTPPLESEPLPPAPPTPPMSSSPRRSPVPCAMDVAAAATAGGDASGPAMDGGQVSAERLGEDCNTERAAASS